MRVALLFIYLRLPVLFIFSVKFCFPTADSIFPATTRRGRQLPKVEYLVFYIVKKPQTGGDNVEV
jgi:hypothetical protein